MNRPRAGNLLSVAVFAGMVTLAFGCGSSKSSTGTGGKGGAAGAAGVGGVGGVGGAGAQALGGTGLGGGTAGASGSGGAATGGGLGGAAAAGGAGGASTDGGAGSAGTAAFAWYFDTTTEGFVLSPFGMTTNILEVDGGTPPTLAWDGTAGNPTPGSLAVSGHFTAYDQGIFTTITLMPPVNATGKTIHASIKLDAGTFPGGVQLQATGGGGTVTGALTPLTAGTWVDVTLDLTAAHAATPQLDPSQLTQIGIQFWTGDAPAGGAAFGAITPMFHIDSVSDGSGGAPPLLSSTFDTGPDGYYLADDLGTPDAAVVPTLTFDATQGSPNAGSLMVSATFNDFGQSVTPIINLSPDLNLTGKTLHAMVKLDAGMFVDGYAVLFASSTANYIWAYGAMTPLTAGTWTALTLVLDTAVAPLGGTFDPTDINQVGVQFVTNLRPAGNSPFPPPEALTFHADSIYVTSP